MAVASGRGDAPAEPVRPLPAALPCLNSNNSIEAGPARLFEEIKEGLEYAGGKTGSSLLPFARQCAQHGVKMLAAARRTIRGSTPNSAAMSFK